MNKTLKEWIKIYEKKSGEKFVRDESYELFYLPDKGFCKIKISGGIIIVNQVCGDGRFWKDFSNEIARRMGLKVGKVYFIRKNPKAYIRLLGFKIVEEKENPQGTKDFICVNDEGKNATVISAYKDKNGNDIYRVMWEV